MSGTVHDSERPAEGQQVITACAFIHKSLAGEHLLFSPRRASTKKFLPSVFELPGGHIDFGEDLKAGLAREIREEFGVAATIGDAFFAHTYTNTVKGSHSVEVIFFAQFTDAEEQITLDPAEHSEYRWLSESMLDEIRDINDKGEDGELQAMRKGFALLRGEQLQFG